MTSSNSEIIDPNLPYPQHPAPPSYAQQSLKALTAAGHQQQHLPQDPPYAQPYYLPSATTSSSAHVPASDSYGTPHPEDDSQGNGRQEHPTALHGGIAAPSEAKRGRACDSCRGLKVRCDFADNPSSGKPCKRCAKAGRPCIVTPATRRRQKKADSRVAELERKVDALTARLAEHDGEREVDELLKEYPIPAKRTASPPTQHASPYREQVRPGSGGAGKRRRVNSSGASPDGIHTDASGITGGEASEQSSTFNNIYNVTRPIVFDHSYVERKISQVVDRATGEYLFNRYLKSFMPRFPAVAFPAGTNADNVRKAKPILFLAILSSTCYGANLPAEKQLTLELTLRDVLADCLWKNGEKSLEIVQALQIASLWYRPPANFEQHMFYQMVHLSAIMAMDIGIGKRLSPESCKFLGRHWRGRALPSTDSAEVRRAWLTSYFLCTTISMVLRRPMLFRFTDYTRECLEYLHTADDALPFDSELCQHVRFARVCEEIATQFALDDPAVSLSISDGKVTYGIKHFENDIMEIVSKGVAGPALKLTEVVTSLYLHEIALHAQNVADLKKPFTEQTFEPTVGQAVVLGPQHVDALTACQSACRLILDTFTSADTDFLYVLPIVFAVRGIYALVVLVKLYLAASAPGEIRNIIKPEQLQVEESIERIRQIFKNFADRDPQSPHSKFLQVVERVQTRFQNIKRGDFNVADATNAVKIAAATASAAVRAPHGAEGKQNHTSAAARQPALGLHALSEAAMIGNLETQQQQAGNHNSNNTYREQTQSQGWYSDAGQPQGTPLDPPTLPYTQPEPWAGMEGFDYGLGDLGMGVDGALAGLFVPDALWNWSEPMGQPASFSAWS